MAMRPGRTPWPRDGVARSAPPLATNPWGASARAIVAQEGLGIPQRCVNVPAAAREGLANVTGMALSRQVGTLANASTVWHGTCCRLQARPRVQCKRHRMDRIIDMTSPSESSMKKTLFWSMICAAALLAAPVHAQGAADDMNMQILRDKVKADKKALVAANMQLSDSEARVFWPIYDQYQNDLRGINERLAKAIVAYADAYNAGPVPDATAKNLLEESIAIDGAEVDLRRTYAARLTAAIPAAKAARYMQIESKIRAAIRYELASRIPLVE